VACPAGQNSVKAMPARTSKTMAIGLMTLSESRDIPPGAALIPISTASRGRRSRRGDQADDADN
jgi:hypothetical protein